MHLSHVEMVKAEKPGSIDAMRLTQHGTERLIGLQLVGFIAHVAHVLRTWS